MPSSLALDSRVLAAVEDLPLLANTIVEGFLDGLHRSPFLGYSTEFSAYLVPPWVPWRCAPVNIVGTLGCTRHVDQRPR